MDKFYWGKFKKVKGEMIKVWLKKPMTREYMEDHHPDYRHMCKELT